MERMTAEHKLPGHYSDGPPVCRFIILLAPDEFRSLVLYRPASLFHYGLAFSSQAKVNHLQIALTVQHQIAELDIVMHHVTFMKLANTFHQLYD